MNQTTNTLQFSPGLLAPAISEELENWQKKNKLQRLWASDSSLWTNQDENKWTGWLSVPELECAELQKIKALAQELKAAAFTDIVLLGMGGSSLCPAMMAETFGKVDDHPRLHILDSTDPSQVRHLDDQLDLKTTFFIVSSKSGSTLEPNLFKKYFYRRVQDVVGKTDVGSYFAAITDPNSSLDHLAQKSNFKAIFYGLPSIGGRYSALSNFGMAPAGLMGIDIKYFLEQARYMMDLCAQMTSLQDNPGVMLGIILGVCAKQGKDKLTFITSPGITALGAWLEQLIAESTGKQGRGIIPVDQEPLGNLSVYGHDRLFAYICLTLDPDPEQERRVIALEKAGQVVVRCNLDNKLHLGAELFRWELATAVASSILGVNPFNQPDVEASKVRTMELMAIHQKTGKMPQDEPIFSDQGFQLFTDETNARDLNRHLKGIPSIEAYLRAHLARVCPGDYVDLSAFIEMSEAHIVLLQQSRLLIRDAKRVATCLEFGPRFLHSTGQIYKGGPNTGVFLQITADPDHDISIPGETYTFGLVLRAQAQADFEVLAQRSRRVLRIHLTQDIGAGLRQLYEILCSLEVQRTLAVF